MSEQISRSPVPARSDLPLREILHVGRILRAHGLSGEVKVLPLTNDPDRFRNLKECLLLAADEKKLRDVHLENARSFQAEVIIKIDGVDDRSQADALRGCYLSVGREQAVVLPPDNWFICDLIGCDVFDEQEGYLGKLADVIQNSAQDVYLVHLAGQPDLLFPALKSILLKVDIPGRRIDVRLSEGLYEVYRERNT